MPSILLFFFSIVRKHPAQNVRGIANQHLRTFERCKPKIPSVDTFCGLNRETVAMFNLFHFLLALTLWVSRSLRVPYLMKLEKEI